MYVLRINIALEHTIFGRKNSKVFWKGA